MKFKTVFITRFCDILIMSSILLLNGCLGYRVGSTLPSNIKTIHVPTFVNQTSEPLLEVECTTAITQEIQKDGSLKIAEGSTADSILEGTMTKITLDSLVFDNTRETATVEYRLTIHASIVLKDRLRDTVLVHNPDVIGETTFEIFSDLSSAKREAIPEAAEDLSRRIMDAILQSW
jgi:hypothetical protein